MKAPSKHWVPEQLDLTRSRLSRAVDPDLLPSDMMEAIGCGRFGCVYETGHPGIVFKLTSDESEALFSKFAMDVSKHEGKFPQGITHCFMVIQTKLLRDRVYAIWRERVTYTSDDAFDAAEDVYGKDDVSMGDRHFLRYDDFAAFAYDHFWSADKRSIRSRLKKFGLPRQREVDLEPEDGKRYKRNALQALKAEHRVNPAHAVAHAIALCMRETYFMQRYNSSRYVGQALAFYIRRGVLLPDVHIGNIGFEPREDAPQGAFTVFDVGQAIFFGFNPKKIRIPTVSDVTQRSWFSR